MYEVNSKWLTQPRWLEMREEIQQKELLEALTIVCKIFLISRKNEFVVKPSDFRDLKGSVIARGGNSAHTKTPEIVKIVRERIYWY